MATSRNSSVGPQARSSTDADINPYAYAYQSLWDRWDSRAASRAQSRAASRATSRAASPAPRASSVQGRSDADINPYSYAFKSVWDRWDSRSASRAQSRAASRATSPARKQQQQQKASQTPLDSADPYVLAYRALWKRLDASKKQQHA